MRRTATPFARPPASILFSTFSILVLLVSALNTGALPRDVHKPAAKGRFVYVANTRSGDISTFRVDPDSGQLSQSGTFHMGGQPTSLTVDPSGGQFAYAVDAQTNNIWMFRLNPGNGKLDSIGTVPAGFQPSAVAIDPIAGRFLMVANEGSGTVSTFRINRGNGTLSPLSSISARSRPTAIGIHPSGRYAYVTGMNSGTAPFFGASESDVVSMFRISSGNGELTYLGSVPAGNEPTAIAVSREGNYAVVTNRSSDTLTVFIIPDEVPLLVPTVTVSLAGSPSSVAVAPSGLAVVTNEASSVVSVFHISSTSGVSLVGIAPVGTSPVAVAVDPTGYAYVANQDSNSVTTIALTPTGSPIPVGSVPAGEAPQAIAIAY
ncbi:MAG: beta-propeller fold lactonase family protein [Acidobacteria bacterium]|nr:beta-propeller fold lactonase family protein [Acidobacteriota bacterium]